MPGGAWRRLYSARSTMRDHALDVLGGKGAGAPARRRPVVLDVALEDGVEHLVGRERLVVALVVTKLGRRRALQHRRGHQLAPRLTVAPAHEIVDQALVHVLQDREAAGHVAVERGVAHRDSDLFPVVSTSQPNLLDRAITAFPLMRAWMFSSVMSGSRAGERPGQHLVVAAHRVLDRQLEKPVPRFPAMARASARVPSLEYGDGMDTQVTFSGPTASAAIIATRAESIPPESASTTCSNPFFST